MAGENGIVLENLRELDRLLEQHSLKALQVLSGYGRRLGLYLSQMVSIFGIKNIGLGGGLSSLAPYFLDSARSTLEHRLAARPWLIPEKIEPAPDPQLSALWGMAYLMLRE